MSWPTIFDLLEQFAFLRGWSAVYLVLAAAIVVVVAWDWRLALLALAFHYLVIGLLYVDLLDPRLAVVKLLVGLFVCLIFYMTARQVNWGRPPPDLPAEQSAFWLPPQRITLGRLRLPARLPLRLGLALLLVAAAWLLAQRPSLQLPGIDEGVAYLNLATLALLGLGLLAAALTTSPLEVGLGVMLFISGFELFYSALEQSVTVLALLAAVNLVVALTLSRLVQVRYAAAVEARVAGE